MRIVSIGGGPAGLYSSILFKLAFPDADVVVYERNKSAETFGWGVVFSAETLGHFREADAPTYDSITKQFIYWDDIETYYGGACVRSTGHGFCGMSRQRLLVTFQERCRELGVELNFEQEITCVEDVGEADLILAVDGINSVVREQFRDAFEPTLDWRKCKFSWLGTDMPMDAFTFFFKENEHGLHRIHAYPFQPGLGTFIVECREETWRKAGLDKADDAATVAYYEKLFADELGGHKLLANNSIWRTFPTVRNKRWQHKNIVIMGDAAHTAHFSIGSGTKLAMEDAIALVKTFRDHPELDVPATLARYEEDRWLDGFKLQKTAQTSLEWFENTERYAQQHPLQFSFNLLTRSKQIAWDNLALRDPELVGRVREWWWDQAREEHLARGGQTWPERLPLESGNTANNAGAGEHGRAPVPMFAPLMVGKVELPNRVAVSPMCQYSATDGVVSDWHLVHLGSRATGGAGLVISEMTDVSPEGRISLGCAGLWNETQATAWRRITDFVHSNSPAKIAVQLAHAGRKASYELPWDGDVPLTDDRAWTTWGPCDQPFTPGAPAPRAMTRADMEKVREQFVASAKLASQGGFDMVEIHMAHGYLLSSYLSPAVNQRTDEYGGSLENRMRFPLEVFKAVRAVWEGPLAVRLSATDWLDDQPGKGITLDETVEIARALESLGCDLFDISTAGNTPESRPVTGRMYQVPFAERIKAAVAVPVMAVGAIQGPSHCNTILATGRADLCAMARPHLESPSIVLSASVDYAHYGQWWPTPYAAAQPRPRSQGLPGR
ncbi:MAG: anthraniloyl-CoA monooxygenase [Pseudohongiellaceae bacterium]|jgi:anthraniloyl-CoA monooxygenase